MELRVCRKKYLQYLLTSFDYIFLRLIIRSYKVYFALFSFIFASEEIEYKVLLVIKRCFLFYKYFIVSMLFYNKISIWLQKTSNLKQLLLTSFLSFPYNHIQKLECLSSNLKTSTTLFVYINFIAKSQQSSLAIISTSLNIFYNSIDFQRSFFLFDAQQLFFERLDIVMPERKMWNENEDRILRFLKEEKGEKKWSVIARKMFSDFGIEGRTGKQCRERYHNHLDQSILITAWSKSQEEILLRMHEQVGNKWSVIAQKLPGRSENCVKNHFYSKLRKSVRKLNKLINDNFKKQCKEIKICSVYKILEICQSSFKVSAKYDEDLIEHCQILKTQLYNLDSLLLHPETKEQDIKQAQKIILELNQLENRNKRSNKSSKQHKDSASTVESRGKQQLADMKKQGSEDSLYWILKRVCDEYMLKEQ